MTADVLRLRPITIRAALAWIDRHHSHHGPPAGGTVAVGVARDGELVCVALAGRPSALRDVTGIDPAHALALDGRITDAAVEYLRTHPEAGVARSSATRARP